MRVLVERVSKIYGSPAASAVYLQRETEYWIKWRSTMPSATMDRVVPLVRELFDLLIVP